MSLSVVMSRERTAAKARIAELIASAPELFPPRGGLCRVKSAARAEVALEIYRLFPFPKDIATAAGVSVWTLWDWLRKDPEIVRRGGLSRHRAWDAPPGAEAIDGEGMTLAEVGDKLQLSRERARQLEAGAIRKLKNRPEARLLLELAADKGAW